MLQIEIEDLDACVLDATTALFEQMLGCEPVPTGPPESAPVGWGAIVTIGAPSPLRLHIVMDGGTVNTVAQSVFGLGADEVTDADCRDLLGEMANIVGGSLKGMFDDATSLSLPTTFATSARYQAPAGSQQSWFLVDDSPFGVWCEVIGG